MTALDILRYFISKLTLPENAVQCLNGEWWIDCNYYDVPGFNIKRWNMMQLYTYQKITQTNLGKWTPTDYWLVGPISLSDCESMDIYRKIH